MKSKRRRLPRLPPLPNKTNHNHTGLLSSVCRNTATPSLPESLLRPPFHSTTPPVPSSLSSISRCTTKDGSLEPPIIGGCALADTGVPPSLFMACKSQYDHLSPKTPPNFANDCHRSKKRHIFVEDRSNKAEKLRFSSLQSTKTSSLSLKKVPVIRCPCGRGPCTIFTSRSAKNPNRDFYTCYQRGSRRQCRFFKWVDEVVEFRVPECPCGAGACSLNRYENGRWLLACRIKKGHGACGFSQWADLRINSKMNMHFHDRIPCASPDCGAFSSLHFEDDEAAFWETVVQELESSNHEDPRSSHSVQDEIPNRDYYSAIQAIESSNGQVLGTLLSEEAKVPSRMSETRSLDDPNLKKICCVTYMVSQSEKACKGDILNQDGIRQYIGLQVGGRLDRQAILPQCRKDQPVWPFCCYDSMLSGVEGPAIGPNDVKDSEAIIQHPPTPSKHAQLPRGVSGCHSRCQNCNTRQNDSTSLSSFKHIGQGLLKTLEDKNLVDREKMRKIAESVFEAFHHLSVNHLSFSKHVMKYIDYKSRLAAVEGSMLEGLSSQLPCGESSCAKNHKLFRNLDQELEQSETIASERKTSLFKINPEMSARQTSMEAAREEMEEAFAEESERKFLLEGARTALVMARAELPS